MKRPITMPALSDTMSNGRLIRWLKQPGDIIKSGDVIAEVETDKAVMEVEAHGDGFLASPLAEAGTEHPVGQTIGFISDIASEARSEVAPMPLILTSAPTLLSAAQPGAPVDTDAFHQEQTSAAGPDARTLDSKSPRGQARARHEAAKTTSATHVAARETINPPIATIPQSAPSLADPDILAGPPFQAKRPSSLRETVARNVSASATIPTFHLTAQISLKPLLVFARKENLSLTLLLARACARTIATHPLFDAAFTPTGLAHRDRIDTGIATDGPDGLTTPALRDVNGRPIAALSSDWQALAKKVKSRHLMPSDYRGATFYLSNLGPFAAVHSFDSIVPTGASAILSVAADRPEGTLLTLNCDHRVVFGSDAARFLQTLDEHLGNPISLF